MQKLVGTLPKLPLFPGEAWSDAAIADLKKMARTQQSDWLALLAHCQAASGSSPSAVWLKKASDSTLSIILSKAFLLAEDAQIKDPTILAQVKTD